MKQIKKMKLTLLVVVMFLLMVGCSSTKKNEAELETTNTPEVTAIEESTNEAGATPEQTTATTLTPAPTQGGSISIVDMKDRTVTFDQVPSKMVVLLASDVEILYEIGAQDSIVAVGEYCNYPEEALEKKVVATGDKMNVEQVIALDPDVVVMGIMGQTKEQTEQLENAGIKVVVTASESIAGTYEAIEVLGQLAGKETEATNLIQEMKDAFAAIKEKAVAKSEKTVYFEVSPLEYGLWTAGSGTFMQELAEIVDLKNAFEDISGWAEVSEEQVIERDPDYIVTSAMYDGQGVSPVDEILGRNNWGELTAVKNEKVFNGNSDMMTRPGPRLVDAANALYEFVYGE